MQNNFETDYQGKSVTVEYQEGSQPNTYKFTVNLPDGPLQLQCQKDNEDAYHWLNEDGSVSDRNRELGEAIESYLVQHHIEL